MFSSQKGGRTTPMPSLDLPLIKGSKPLLQPKDAHPELWPDFFFTWINLYNKFLNQSIAPFMWWISCDNSSVIHLPGFKIKFQIKGDKLFSTSGNQVHYSNQEIKSKIKNWQYAQWVAPLQQQHLQDKCEEGQCSQIPKCFLFISEHLLTQIG